MSTPRIQLRCVRKTYDQAFSLEFAKLDVAAGETLCLLGPTGSGKSTLLRIMAGLESLNEGELKLDNAPWNGRGDSLAAHRRVTLVFQRPLLLDGSVRTNVEYGLRLRHRRPRREQVDAMLDRLGLSSLAEQSAKSLSGGQTQLVALARALVVEPDVLLLDEICSNLDPARVGLVEEVIAQDQQRRGTTIVWATHNLFQARRVGTRVALLLAGRLVEVAGAEEFFESPRDPRTADFVQGKMIY